MVPIENILANLSGRDSTNLSITVLNPVQNRKFVTTVVGAAVGAVVFLLLIALILVLYRENSPLSRCRRRREVTASDTRSLDLTSSALAPSVANVGTKLVKEEDTVDELRGSLWVDVARHTVSLPKR
jgi:hypothetical protein